MAALAGRIQDASLDALANLPASKVADLTEKWFAKADLDPKDAENRWRMARMIALAGLVALFTPSLAGPCPLDRFLRDRRAKADAAACAAFDALARAEFHLLRILSRASEDALLAENLADGARLTLRYSDLPDSALQIDIAAWLAPLPTGDHCVVGLVLPLDAATLAEGMAFVRAGRGLSNPRRCAAAVYRHVARHGGLLIQGINTIPEGEPDDGLSDLTDGPTDPFHRLAEEFAQAQGDPPAEAIREARAYASAPYLVEALGRSVIMRRLGRREQAEAYSRMAYEMVETLDRRIAAGYAKEFRSLADVAAFVDRSVSEAGAPAEIRAMFDDLRRRSIAARGARTSRDADDKELARVLQLIRALRAKTVDQGCSEQEALASARKVAELLDRYGLSLGEVEMREQSCEGVALETGRKRRAPIDECAPAVAAFCDCRIWFEKSADGSIRFVFFGLPADVAAAHCIHDLIVLAFGAETTAFKKRSVSGPKPSTRSFEIGLAHGIALKLREMKVERDAANCASGGRALVPIKASVVEEELERLGLSFRTKAQSRSRRVEVEAFEAGVAAGRKFEPHRSVDSA